MDLSKFKKLQSPYILILVGPPLSGKSFFVKSYLKEVDQNVEVISRDQILLDLHTNDNYSEAFKSVNQKQVDATLVSKMTDASKSYKNVIIDMTNLSSKRRRTTLEYFDEKYYKVAVVFPILERSEYTKRNITRNEQENKFIPEHVIDSMISSFTPIKYDEGFNKIISL